MWARTRGGRYCTTNRNARLRYTLEVRWSVIFLCLVMIGCRFDTSTVNPPETGAEIDGAVVNGSIDADLLAIDADLTDIDAQVSTPDASDCGTDCLAKGGTCGLGGTCEFTCTDFTSCGSIACPYDVPCVVTCTNTLGGASPCGSIACSNAMPCVVNCIDATGNDNTACGSVSCNNTCSCQVNCTGSDNACGSLACNSDCGGDESCDGTGDCNTCS
jgi:hypothetical protein